ncbi:MAG TPA: heat-inducible transcriptional repressor HrcA [Vicinamibacterales bacterium]|nr:heat-inducible transcriptional repressor HrcA [Vicinamibacterales bacterium]
MPERDRRVLGVVVQAYIDQGEPISSLWLAGRGLGVSSATLRTIMARLEEQGFVRQPHTSAGRVPTDLGYRSYVDQLLVARRSARAAPHIEARLRRAGSVDDLLSHASQEVSRASHQVGFAIAPPADSATLEQLDLVALEGGKVLVVVIAAGGHVSHTVLEPAEQFDRDELQRAANYLNSEFKGRTLLDVRQQVVQRLREERTLYDVLMARALRLAYETLAELSGGPAVYVQGAALMIEEFGNDDPDITLETLRTLLQMMEEKARLVRLLDEYLDAGGLTVVIGSEHLAPDLQRFSLILAPYSDGRNRGALGVIGPTRMHYGRALNAVESLSKALARTVSARP